MRKEDRIIFHRELGKIIEPKLPKVKKGWRYELATRDIYTKRIKKYFWKYKNEERRFINWLIPPKYHFGRGYYTLTWMEEIAPYTWLFHFWDYERRDYFQFKISIREKRELHPNDDGPNELYLIYEKTLHNGGNTRIGRLVVTQHGGENDDSFICSYHRYHPGTPYTNRIRDAGCSDFQFCEIVQSLAYKITTRILNRNNNGLPKIRMELEQVVPIFMAFCYRYKRCKFELDDPNYSCDQRPKPAFMEYLRPGEL